MNKHYIIFLSAAAAFVIVLALFQYVFSIYEISIKLEPEELYSDGVSTVKLKTIPLNSFGGKAPFRKVGFTYEVTEGNDLIEVVNDDSESGELEIKGVGKTGEVVIVIKTKLAVFPIQIKIPVVPNIA